MTPKVLSILIIGGENSAEVYSGCLESGGSKGYVPQFVRQLQRIGWQVQVECHAPIDIHIALPLLQRLNLNRFDLIILELGHTRLQGANALSELLRPSAYTSCKPNEKPVNTQNVAATCNNGLSRPNPGDRGLSQLKLGILQLMDSIGKVGRLLEIKAQLTDLLYYVHPHRRRLVILTPLPHPQPITNWLRKKGQYLFGQLGRRHMIPVFDTATVIGQSEEFFTNANQGHLSPVAGDLLGQTLFDYIQNNALLPAHPELRQRRGY